MTFGKSAAGRSYAKGRRAIAECQRSGQKMRYRDLVEDGHIAGLLVHPSWWEPKHPQEIPEGYGDPENLDGGTTPTSTSSTQTGTLLATINPGDTSLALVDAANLRPWNDWIFIPQDGGGNFVTRTVQGYASGNNNEPTFWFPFTTPFPTGQLATAGATITFGEAP
jgi:hypothetical protein